MPLRICAGAVIAAALFITPSYALPPVEAFGNLPMLTEPELSPDGKYFAALQDMDGKSVGVIYPVNAGGRPQVFAVGDGTAFGVHWIKNDRAVLLIKGNLHIRGSAYITEIRGLIIGVDGSDGVQIARQNRFFYNNGFVGAVFDKIASDPDHILMPLFTLNSSGDHFLYSIYSVDVHDGRTQMAEQGTFDTFDWITDGAGNIIGRVDESTKPRTDHLYLRRGKDWVKVRDIDARADFGIQAFGLTGDGKYIAASIRNAQNRIAIGTFDAVTGADGPVLFSDPQFDVNRVLLDEWTGRVIGVAYMRDKMEYVYFSKDRQDLQADIEKAFPGLSAHAVSVTGDGSVAIVEAEGPTAPPSYFYLDRKTNKAVLIAQEYPRLSAADLGTVTPYDYTARDGQKIHSYLTTPPGRTAAKNLPLVVMPHGGPGERDYITFDWWAQFLANRGYAVFQPNFRGSTGYGRDFRDAGFRQWGLRMQDDVTDGVKALIADGTADARRICIVGASYGGYAALAGATFTPDLYACAVSIAGVSDLPHMFHDTYKVDPDDLTWVQREVGLSDDPKFLETSPDRHADQVKIPILLMHGKADTTVPYDESERERDALADAGKPVQLITFDKDDHYFTLGSTRNAMLSTLERFLHDHIGGP